MNKSVLAKIATKVTVAASVLVLSACGGQGALSGSGTGGAKTLKVGILGDFSSVDPDVAYDGTELNLVNSAYEGLLHYQTGSSTPKLEGVLAKDWTVSGNNTIYTFDLVHGVTFHDGTKFTSAAIEPSFKRRLAVGKGPAYMVAGVKSIQTEGDYKVKITLKSPNSAFLAYLASPFGPKMLSPKVLKGNPNNNASDYLATKDAGTGPYQYINFTPGTSYSLKAYDKYWGNKPGYSKIVFTSYSNMASVQLKLESGQLDGFLGYTDKATFQDIKSKDSGKLNAYTYDSMQSPLLFINPMSGSLSNQNVRLKLLSGIDFTSLVNEAAGNLAQVSNAAFPKTLLGTAANDQNVTYDAKALSQLSSGALSGKTISIAYPSTSPDAKAYCDNLAAHLNAAGIKATSTGYAQGTYYSTLAKGAAAPDLTVFTGFPDAADPACWGNVFYIPGGGLDLFGANVNGVSDLLNKASITSNSIEREKLYGQVAQKISASGYWHTIAMSKGTAIFNKSVSSVDKANVPVITSVLDMKVLKPQS